MRKPRDADGGPPAGEAPIDGERGAAAGLSAGPKGLCHAFRKNGMQAQSLFLFSREN